MLISLFTAQAYVEAELTAYGKIHKDLGCSDFQIGDLWRSLPMSIVECLYLFANSYLCTYIYIYNLSRNITTPIPPLYILVVVTHSLL